MNIYLHTKYPKIAKTNLNCLNSFSDWGWFPLLIKLMDKLYPLIEKEDMFIDFKIMQIKEKFGSLRFYILIGTDEMYSVINEAEELSTHICEECGSLENIVYTKGWIQTLCITCGNKSKKDYKKRLPENIPTELLIEWKFINN